MGRRLWRGCRACSRIFNPILQSGKFDPDGMYVRRWMPEPTELSTKIIHRPWRVTPRALKNAGITLGKDDPALIVDRKTGRERTLKAYITIRNS